jgi:predicted O-methyltransferase YrrM
LSFRHLLRAAQLAWLSQPAADRVIYRAIRRIKAKQIVECGMGIGQRAVRMIEMARMKRPDDDVSYTGIDLFEGRSSADGPGVTLKMAHRLLRGTGARVRLVPGDVGSALPRVANSLTGTDLMVISARQSPTSLARAWFYLPRIISSGGIVFLEQMQPGGKIVMRQMTPSEIVQPSAWQGRRAA